MKTRILTAATISAATIMTLVPGALAQPAQVPDGISIITPPTVVTLPPTIPPIQPTPSLVPLPTLPPVVTVPDLELCLNINIELCEVDDVDDILLPPGSTTPTTTPGPDEEGIGDPTPPTTPPGPDEEGIGEPTPPTVPEPEPPVEPEPETPTEPEAEPETPTEPEADDSDDNAGDLLGDIDAPRPGTPNFAG